MNPATATFDEIVDLYEAGPMKFIEGIFGKRRWQFAISDECESCRSWDEINKTPARHVTRKDHDQLGALPWPHKFESSVGFFLLEGLSKEELRKTINSARRGRRENELDLLRLYLREKFGARG
jgi:hypothetical protein